MKIHELLESKLTESYNFSGMQQIIYKIVLKKMKALNPDMHDSYANELARTTDQFWVDDFDAVDKAFTRADDLDEFIESILNAIDSVCQSVIEYFVDPMNHPPGYSVRKLKGIDVDAITDKEVLAIIKEVDPNVLAEIEATEKKAVEADKALRAQQKASITKEKLDEVAALVKKYDTKGWESFYKIIKKDKHILGYFPKGTTQEIIDGFRSSSELKEFFKKMGGKEYVREICDNIQNINTPKEDGIKISDLRIISRDTSLSNKLIKLIA